VARQFHDAVSQVRHLRKQVKEIQETLGAGGNAAPPAAVQTAGKAALPNQAAVAAAAASSAMSLRELWLKKLECEAVLSLLEKLDTIRAAPLQFDTYLIHHRIGAAVLCVAQALDTMFSSDVSQVQALHKIMEQLMMRKQRAEEVVWELLQDVLFLRTGNGMAQLMAMGGPQAKGLLSGGGGAGGGMNARRSLMGAPSVNSGGPTDLNSTAEGIVPVGGGATASAAAAASHLWNLPPSSWDYIYRQSMGIVNPFLTTKMRFALDPDLQVDSILLTMEQKVQEVLVDEDFYEDDDDAAMMMNGEGVMDGGDEKKQDANGVANGGGKLTVRTDTTSGRTRLIIPAGMMEAEFDLEADERRSLEEQQYDSQGRRRQQSLAMTKPTYLDHVLGLRTLVECLVRLRRLDDVERIVAEALERELPQLVQREQARTYLWVEKSATNQLRKSGRYSMLLTKAGATTDLRDFRRHLNHILSAFGNVQLRLVHLVQVIRHKLSAEKSHHAGYSNSSVALRNLLVNARSIMEHELKSFLDACLLESTLEKNQKQGMVLDSVSGQSRPSNKSSGKKRDNGLFSLGIIDSGEKDQESESHQWHASTTSSRRSTIQSYTTPKFVLEILFAKTTQNGSPQIRHALFFRKALAKWQRDNEQLRYQLAVATGEDTSNSTYLAQREQPALEYLDNIIQKDLLPVLQEEAVNGTVQALERPDAFDPVLDRNVYARADSNEPQDVDMCKACTALYNFTGPLFLALHRLPQGGDMYLPLVAVLEHVILTFISRVKQQVNRICNNKTALQLLMDTTAASAAGTVVGNDGKAKSQVQSFGHVMERRKAFAQLVLAYADGDLLEAVNDEKTGELSVVPSIPAPAADTPRTPSEMNKIAGMEDLDLVGGVEREESNLSVELHFVKPYLEFAGMELAQIKICSDEDLMKAACLAHSLLKLSSLLDSRLKIRSRLGITSTKTLTNTRALREAIKTIKANGLKMAKFCRSDILLQSITRLSKICNSSTIVARDAVRIPSSVNDLGEYMTAASDNLREAAGNAVTAYAFSTLEQYIPLCLIQTVRVLAAGKGVIAKAPLTMNGIEALDRSGSVLYRDLKGATSFDNSFWDIELAAVSFERSASFIAMMELEMPELEAYYQENRNDFSEQDFRLMFSMDGPRRKGDVGRYNMLVKKLDG
jgi:hypothetical protein